MSIRIKRHLQSQYPELLSVLSRTKTIPRLKRREMPLPEALVRVVTGQMLSSKVANTIYHRIVKKAEERALPGSWMLDFESLRACGLSRAKARTICELGSHIGQDVSALDFWYELPPESLFEEVRKYKGMGGWTASIISLFYVGHEDVFPLGDGSLRRAMQVLQRQTKRRRPLDPNRATPYRSYLALYLWNALDTGAFDEE